MRGRALTFAVLAIAAAGTGFSLGWRRAPRARRPAAAAVEPLPSMFATTLEADEARRRFPFHVGDRWVYSARWQGIAVGQVTVEVAEKTAFTPRVASDSPPGAWAGYPKDFQRPVYRITAQTRSNSWLNTFYKVSDRIESLVDAEGTFSWQWSQFIREGRREKDQYMEFDQLNHAAHYFRRHVDEGQTEYKYEYSRGPTSDRVQDPMSAVIYFTLLPISAGQRLNIPVHTDKQDWDTRIDVVEEERIETPAGKFDCWLIKPGYEYEGLFIKSSDPKLWVDKSDRMPVKMEVDVALGSVRVVLLEKSRGPASLEAR